MRFANLTALIQVRQIPRCRCRSRIRACVHDACIERAGTSSQRIQRKGGGHIRGVYEIVRFTQSQAQQRQHALGAVQQRESFFRFERDRSNSRALHGFAARQDFSAECRAALANHDLRQVRQRRKVARSAHRALRRNHRMDFGIQHLAKRLDHLRPHAAEPLGQRIRAQQHHRACLRRNQRRADAASVRTHQIYLQLPHLFCGDAHRSEFSEARIDSVSRFPRCHQPINHCARSVHPFDCRRRQLDLFAAQRHIVELRKREIVPAQSDAHTLLRSGCGATMELNTLWYFFGNNFGRPLLPQITCVVSPFARTFPSALRMTS